MVNMYKSRLYLNWDENLMNSKNYKSKYKDYDMITIIVVEKDEGPQSLVRREVKET